MANPVSNGVQRDVNFGGNQSWLSRRYRPANESELLNILSRHSRDTIRALGSKHSWSDIAAGSAVSLDMSGFDEVEPFVREGRHFVRVGAYESAPERARTAPIALLRFPKIKSKF